MHKKHLSMRAKAASIGLSVAHYTLVVRHISKPSYHVAREIGRLEGVHFLHLLDPERYDERGKLNRKLSGDFLAITKNTADITS